MRAVGLTLGFMASVSLVFGSVAPAFAQENAPPSNPASPAVQDAKENKETEKEIAKEKTAHDQTAVPLDGMTKVHIQAPQQVGLEKRQGANADWQHVCNSPCDERLSVNDEYRIVGDELNASKPFMLDAKGDSVTLNVQPGKHSKYVTGVWVLAGGAVLGVVGTVLIIAGSSSSSTFTSDGLTHDSNTNWIAGGTVLILGGVAAAITGGAMALDNVHTNVNGDVATATEKKSTPASATVQLSASRQPTFREAEKLGQPASFVVPVFKGTF